MTIVLTNDDGIDAPGIRALREALHRLGRHRYVAIAPNAHLSGCSHQLTRGYPISLEHRSETDIAVGGTPADCTRIAVSHLCPDVEVVLSGINAGGNLGADIHVSGTVAAVREAALHRVPGIAVSHYIHRRRPIDWDYAARITAQVLDKLLALPYEPGTFWNVNLPHPDAGEPDPEMVFCGLCTQPLPANYLREADSVCDTSDYSQRSRDPGADVDVCFSGKVSITQIRLW